MVFFVVLCLGTMITLLKRKVWLIVFIPLSLFIATSIFYTYTDILGTPTKKELPKEFFVIHHHAAEELEVIYLWVVVKGKNVPVSYEIPYSLETQEKLDNYKQLIEESGSTAVIRGITQDEKTGSDFELYYFSQQEYL
ncbi:uncharacterized protein METZ01_LOCUS299424, partial [marine metagenome]